MSKKGMTIFYILLILLFGGVYYIDEHVLCNPKGSHAAKINWAGHGECSE